MAGITNAPFRTLCREFSGGKGLFVSEMITTRALVERNEKTMQLIHFDETERPRSIQLYGVDPDTVGKAARMIAEEDLADHIDLNFGCPVPKVTRKGGGSALPYKRNLLRAILREAVANAGSLPVTNTIGTPVVAFLAASAPSTLVTMTFTGWRTSSSNCPGS